MAERFNLRDAKELRPDMITPQWLEKNFPRREGGDAIGIRPILDADTGEELGKAMQIRGQVFKYDPESFNKISEYIQASPQADLENAVIPEEQLPEAELKDVQVTPLQPSKKDIKGPSTDTGISEPEAVEPIRTEAEMPSKALEQASQDEPLVSQIGQAIQSGNSNEAIRLIDAALGAQDVVDRFRKDLTPESMNADLLRAFSERRQGRNPSMTLTRTGQFGGEKRSPDEIERTGQRDRFGMLRELVGARQRGETIKNDISRIESNIALRVAELDRLNDRFATQQAFLRDKEAVDRANSIIDGLFKQVDVLQKQLDFIPNNEQGDAELKQAKKRIADKLELAQKLRLKLLGN